jgi:ADP-ribose pyrophosphatase YjhB (NUDIX family)
MRHLPAPIYSALKRLVPILCVDLLPINANDDGLVGLVRRRGAQPGEKGWAMVGGRVYRNEPVEDAVLRHLVDALGDRVTLRSQPLIGPVVAEYFPHRQPDRLWDPRQHAVSLTYVARVWGDPVPQGEALGFDWFPGDALPNASSWVYGHDRVVRRILALHAERS